MSEDPMAAMQEMAAPSADHERLTPFLGTFKAEVRIWMGPGDPMVSTGSMTNTWALGGRLLPWSTTITTESRCISPRAIRSSGAWRSITPVAGRLQWL